MGGHGQDHGHHEAENPAVCFKVGIFFICVLVTLYFLAI